MSVPTEPIGSIPRPAALLEAMTAHAAGHLPKDRLLAAEDAALRDTIARFEETDSPVITDGEQTKPSFATYPLVGLRNLAPDGVSIPFADGHARQLPKLTGGPFRYGQHALSYLVAAKRYTKRPLKQAVISASALSLLCPQNGLSGYSREVFLDDLIEEARRDIHECLEEGASYVQIDFTEGRLALKLDPSGGLLNSFIELNNRVLDGFSPTERQRIGVHTCPGGDRDSTHSADIDYLALLPLLFRLNVGRFYIQLASERDRRRVLRVIQEQLKPGVFVFFGVTDPINPTIETSEQVRDRILEAAEFIPTESLGTTDDCGFSPFADDTSTSRDTAFAKIRSRVEGTRLAAEALQAKSQRASSAGT
ncbi:MAG TPA: cobalamin-independent methionine synthase II family protein [Acidobacteriota bacterium]|nr:cobalamin-independent methionine synthase II family protein [Acidobacteriota bacterium]